jgi:hypothetical protein
MLLIHWCKFCLLLILGPLFKNHWFMKPKIPCSLLCSLYTASKETYFIDTFVTIIHLQNKWDRISFKMSAKGHPWSYKYTRIVSASLKAIDFQSRMNSRIIFTCYQHLKKPERTSRLNTKREWRASTEQWWQNRP